MADYARVIETGSIDEAQRMIDNGWEIINTTTVTEPDGHSYFKYLIGFSYKDMANSLLSIVKDYEEQGFKDQLFEKIALKNDEKLEDYTRGGFYSASTPLTKYMKNYDLVVDDKITSYEKVREQESYDDIEF